MGVPKDVANRRYKYQDNHTAHHRRQSRVNTCGGLDALQIQQRENHRKEYFPTPHRHRRCEYVRLPSAPYRANQRIHDVVHHHAPPGDVPHGRMNFPRHVSECRTRARVNPRHSPVTDRRGEHGHHGDEDRCDYVTAPAVAQRSKRGHGCDRLKHDNPVEE